MQGVERGPGDVPEIMFYPVLNDDRYKNLCCADLLSLGITSITTMCTPSIWTLSPGASWHHWGLGLLQDPAVKWLLLLRAASSSMGATPNR